MYALLAGRPPFQAKTMPEMLQLQRFAEPEPVRRYATETPDQLNKLIAQLLAKDPDDRFPNVLVLGRHMEAMEKALSRPLQSPPEKKKSDSRQHKVDPAAHHATAEVRDEATRALEKPLPESHDTKSEKIATDIYDAATLDQPGDIQLTEHEPPPPTIPGPLHSSFTTVDEEKRRQQELASGNIWIISLQLASLITLLIMLVWGGWRLMRPASADELFQEITTKVELQGDEDLRMISTQLDEFSIRFGDDPRNQELDRLRSQLEFQLFERQTRRKAREADVSPIGSLYLAAGDRAQSDPFAALGMLQDLLTLYDPFGATRDIQPSETGSNDSPFAETDQRWLVLARQEIEELQRIIDSEAIAQLPALQNRLSAAAALERTDPQRAARMYKAIVSLYGDQPWAREAVAQARVRAAELDSGFTE